MDLPQSCDQTANRTQAGGEGIIEDSILVRATRHITVLAGLIIYVSPPAGFRYVRVFQVPAGLHLKHYYGLYRQATECECLYLLS